MTSFNFSLSEAQRLKIIEVLPFVAIKSPKYEFEIALTIVIKGDISAIQLIPWDYFDDDNFVIIAQNIISDETANSLIANSHNTNHCLIINAIHFYKRKIDTLPDNTYEKTAYLHLLQNDVQYEIVKNLLTYTLCPSLIFIDLLDKISAFHILRQGHLKSIHNNYKEIDIPINLLDILYKPPNGIAWLKTVEKLKIAETNYNSVCQ